MSGDDVPRWYGLYRGKVFDANDPSRKGRLRIIVPVVNGSNDALDWAMPCVPPGWFNGLVKPHANHVFTDNDDGTGASGNATETLVHTNNTLPSGSDPGGHVPHKRTPLHGDPVWVMFEAGDARRPVWMGTWI